jgi:hypothetical protein
MTPATPMLATLTEAAPVEELPLAPVVVPAADVGLADVAAGVVAVVVGFVVAGTLEDETEELLELAAELAAELAPELVAADELDPDAEELPPPFKQLVSDPELIENAAEEAVAPVLSRMVRPMEVPAAMSVFHVSEVPLCWPRFSRAVAVGWFPGRMLKK